MAACMAPTTAGTPAGAQTAPPGSPTARTANDRRRPVVIAHRGASGHLPEHTLAAIALAHAMGADYLEQDVVLTRDGHPIVLHDIHLDRVTNVRQVFPDRHRSDGRYYAADFTLDQVRRLRVHERVQGDGGQPVFPERFPAQPALFSIPTLVEEIQMIQSLNRTTGREAGIYVEIKNPAWHRQQGHDLTAIILATLDKFGYTRRQDLCYVQCFDAQELRRVRSELHSDLKLILLIGQDDRDAPPERRSWSSEGLRQVATYADGVGPDLQLLVESAEGPAVRPSPLVAEAQRLGLEVHPYTFRADALPNFANSYDELLQIYLGELGVDGLFTDFPDRTVRYLQSLAAPAR
jgi:glycerophosphoryl diester phosphodiesterase